MSSLTLTELFSLLGARQPLGVPRQDTRICNIVEDNPRFVAPTFRALRSFSRGQTSLVLVSAPAALGKSTLAKHIAHKKGVPFCDLGAPQFAVGSGSLEGTIVQVFAKSAATVLDQLTTGGALLVLDALDEAELRVSPFSFEAFLRDVCSLCQQPRQEPAFVLLARSDTAELVTVALQEASVPYAHLEIEFFDEQGANEFVEKYLDFLGVTTHRQHVQPFQGAKHALFDLVSRLIRGDASGDPWNDEGVRAFLGYAPVLEVLSQELDDDENYQRVERRLQSGTSELSKPGQSPVWHFMADVVQKLLAREQEKFVKAQKRALEGVARQCGWDSWQVLYTPSEQCQRLLDRLTNMSLQPRLPADLPTALRQPYEAAVKAALGNHPFVKGRGQFANDVFREYLYAWHLVKGLDSVRALTRAEMRRPSYLPTPLLGRFLLSESMSPGQNLPLIDAVDVGFLYESFVSGAVKAGSVWLSLTTVPGQDLIQGVIRVGQDEENAAEFTLRPKGQAMWFWRQLSYAYITVAGDVELGVSGGSFTLGPNVAIECGSLDCPAEGLEVRTANDQDVALIAENSGPNQPNLKLRVHGNGQFGVKWPQVAYPWGEHILPTSPPAPPDVSAGYKRFCRVMEWFKASGYAGDLAAPVRLLDGYPGFGRDELGEKLKTLLLSKRLIVQKGRLYLLNREQMATLGLSWQSIRRREASDAVIALLREFLQQRRN